MKTVFTLFKRTAQEYAADNCSNMAAAISYYVIFSVVPLTVFLLSIFGFVVQSEDIREDVSEAIVDFVGIEAGDRRIEPDRAALEEKFGPTAIAEIEEELSGLTSEEQEQIAARLEDEGLSVWVADRLLSRDDLKIRSDNVVIDTLRGVSSVSAPLSLVGLVGMAWSASAMFGAIRKSINIAWDLEKHRPVVQQKLIDMGMVLALGFFLLVSVVTTGVLRTIRELSDENLGPLSEGTSIFWDIVPFILPAFFTFLMFAFVYRFVPATKVEFRYMWPGALLATILFEIVKNAFAIYIANFSNYDLAYGALGGILIFLLWTYITSNILLLGAEMASEYPRVLRGDYETPAGAPAGPKRSLVQTVMRTARGLVVEHPPEEEAAPPPDDEPAEPEEPKPAETPPPARPAKAEREE